MPAADKSIITLSDPQKTALIYGVTGRNGAYPAKLLVERGYRVVDASHNAQISTLGNLIRLGVRDEVEVKPMAVSNFCSVLQELARVRRQEAYNLAGQSSVGLSFEPPVATLECIRMGALNLLEGLRFLGLSSRFYNAASSECFGSTYSEAATKLTCFSPRWPYGVAKAAAYWQVANYRESYGLFACPCILFNHESPLRPERFVTQKIIRTACRIPARSGETLTMDNLAIERDWAWAPEYVETMWLMLQHDEPQDFGIATSASYTLSNFIEFAFDALRLDWRRHVRSDAGLLRPSGVRSSRADPSSAATRLGWRALMKTPEVARRMIESTRSFDGSTNRLEAQ